MEAVTAVGRVDGGDVRADRGEFVRDALNGKRLRGGGRLDLPGAGGVPARLDRATAPDEGGELRPHVELPDPRVAQRLVDRRLPRGAEQEVLEETADLAVAERRDGRRAMAEHSSQCPADVVLAAPLPCAKLSSGTDPAFARIEPKHYLAERDLVELTSAWRVDCE